MKKAILTGALSVFLIMGVLLAGCSAAIMSKEVGPNTAKTYDNTGFSRIEIGDAFELEVTATDTYSIQIEASEGILDRIKVTQNGDKLEIGMDNPFFHTYRSPRVKITMPELKGLYLSGASEGNVSGFKSATNFELTLSGASELDMNMETGAFISEISGASEVSGYLKATSGNIDLSGASSIDLNGSGGDIRLEASGASDLNLANFTVNNADIKFSGASDGSLDVYGILDADLGGSSTLEYSGNPTLGNIEITGGSEIERR